MSLARIGLGANLGDPVATIGAAVDRLRDVGDVQAVSALYRTPAWGVVDQPPFVNAAALLETELSPHALLTALKRIEADLGRVASFRWGPRAIDLDILAIDDLHVDDPSLTIPHARLAERAFALVPLADIDATYIVLRDALPESERASIERIAPLDGEAHD